MRELQIGETVELRGVQLYTNAKFDEDSDKIKKTRIV